MATRINPQNNLPEPLGIIVLVANFCFGLWNVYSNIRQESKQTAYDKRQKEIIALLDEIKNEFKKGE
ncbi:MAG: hypothetical protein HDT14_13800 [Oscillibacter sp.]|nr:hypothetical protein [Oscillibacter sp.]